MKYVYLVRCINTVLENPMRILVEIFTSEKKANAYAEFWNSLKNHPYEYWVEEKKICTEDCTHLNKSRKKGGH